MFQNAFIGKPKKPTEAEVAQQLGPSKALWDQLLAELAAENRIAGEWHSYSRKAGWSQRLKLGARTILYLSPCQGTFWASFALGDKALKAARQSGLPKCMLEIIDQAKRYTEGTAVRIEVKGPDDVAVVKKLAVAKLEN